MSIFTCILSLSCSLAMNFGLFFQELRHYVHFRHRHLRFLQHCDFFWIFYLPWCFLMSIFTCILSLFVVADNEFWTFFSSFAALCPFSAQALAFSSILWLVFGYFCFLMLPYVHFHLHPFTFRGRRRWILDFFPKNCSIMSIFGIGTYSFFNTMAWVYNIQQLWFANS